ncbi:FIG007785: exported protein [hydrothermal vent metagenome]|uniref:FIG007785: exported protein n=1 Tax=hydrothermal vent metagenome TaxID=652676 RepID=A0A3B0R0T3_9ZZZZ
MMIFQKLTRNRFAGTLLALLVLVFGTSGVLAQKFPTDIVKIQTTKGEFVFKTEIAITNEQRRMGLMFRKSMAEDAAMLFSWREQQPVSMWMKNTYISLDMIFIRQNGQVANIARATTPLSLETVSSDGLVGAVLEVIAGTADRIGLKPGDMVLLPKAQ